jgi:hypothetical protein
MNRFCSDVVDPKTKNVWSKGCGAELVVVPDQKGTGSTVCCPHCDELHKWPKRKLK